MLACTQYDCDRLAVRALIPFRAVVLYWPRTHQMCEDDEESRNVMDNGQADGAFTASKNCILHTN